MDYPNDCAASTNRCRKIGGNAGQKQRHGRQRQRVVEAMVISTSRSVGSLLRRQILSGVMGSIFKGL